MKSYLRLGRKGNLKKYGGYRNGFVKPSSRSEKRRASKRVRHTRDVSDGNEYKKSWGFWEWC